MSCSIMKTHGLIPRSSEIGNGQGIQEDGGDNDDNGDDEND